MNALEKIPLKTVFLKMPSLDDILSISPFSAFFNDFFLTGQKSGGMMVDTKRTLHLRPYIPFENCRAEVVQMKTFKSEKELFKTLADIFKKEERAILAIDGKCAAGKTTLSSRLAALTGIPEIHGDDFFIPASKRGLPHFAPHANIDAERLLREVLSPLSERLKGSYGVFDCGSQSITQTKTFDGSSSLILEGSYLLHPAFRFAYTHTLFLDVDPVLQRKRILQREGEGAEQFFEHWIPLEEDYISAYSLPLNIDFYLKEENSLEFFPVP